MLKSVSGEMGGLENATNQRSIRIDTKTTN